MSERLDDVETGDRPDVTVVVPASNARPNIGRTLDFLIASLAPQASFEILVVVNDAIPGPVVSDVRLYRVNTDPRVELHQLPGGDKAAAIRYGFERARGRVWGYSDGDLGWQARVDETGEMLSLVLSGACDLVAAERDQSQWTPIRRWKTNVFRWVGRWVFRHHLVDSQAPLKFMTAEVGRAVLGSCAFRGWEFDVELLWWVRRFGYRIRPYPVHWSTTGTETTLETVVLGLVFMGPAMVVNLARVRVRAWFLQRRLIRRYRRTPA
ncbi:glycosyltransferase [Plantactinospora soyae]|uniref:Glycosyltransferase involved in cell wall biosynthesis n=1 Tax=Plantactinospora soyae TaxID=1544732 RepID=A0A927M9T7_9ACTN|nr:glycosyltransferase [Plantactinospora soyae]MBE1489590.1 glycosyltransferase involved in cell wall biosynthesis [Plantactinospora soyae]